MARKKMVNGQWLDVPSVSGRASNAGKSSAAGSSAVNKRHTAQNEDAEDQIFQNLLTKRKEE
jgi:hypothetical protein